MRHGADRYNQAVKVPNKTASLFVSKQGNDANAGTYEKPKLTVANACAAATAGTTIYVRAGTYVEHVDIGVAGTAAARITLRNYPNERAKLNGGANSCLHVQGDYGYWTIFGLEATSTDNTSYEAGWGLLVEHDWTIEGPPGVWVYQNIPSWMVERCWMDCGIHLHGADSTARYNLQDGSTNVAGAIRGAIFFRNVVTTGAQIYRNVIDNWTGAGIWTYDEVQDPQIYGNIIRNIIADVDNCFGIALDGYGSHHDGGDIINNYIADVPGAGAVMGEGITLENALSSPIVDGNIFERCEIAISVMNYDAPVDHRGTAINGVIKNNIVIDCEHAFKIITCKGVDWYHNTILDCTADEAIWFEGDELYLTGHDFANNILHGGTGAAVVFYVPLTRTLIASSNYNCWDNGTTNMVLEGTTWSNYWWDDDPNPDWQSVGYDANGVNAAPLFVDEVGHNLRLQDASPARNTGTNLGVTTTVELNATRPLGITDMGAYERA